MTELCRWKTSCYWLPGMSWWEKWGVHVAISSDWRESTVLMKQFCLGCGRRILWICTWDKMTSNYTVYIYQYQFPDLKFIVPLLNIMYSLRETDKEGYMYSLSVELLKCRIISDFQNEKIKVKMLNLIIEELDGLCQILLYLSGSILLKRWVSLRDGKAQKNTHCKVCPIIVLKEKYSIKCKICWWW